MCSDDGVSLGVDIPCGLVVRIRRSHRRGRGSIPRMGVLICFWVFSPTFFPFYVVTTILQAPHIVWESGSTGNFTITVKLQYPDHTVTYPFMERHNVPQLWRVALTCMCVMMYVL